VTRSQRGGKRRKLAQPPRREVGPLAVRVAGGAGRRVDAATAALPDADRGSPRRVLHAVAAAIAEHVTAQSATCRVLMEARALAAYEPAIAAAVRAADARVHQQLEELIARRGRAGAVLIAAAQVAGPSGRAGRDAQPGPSRWSAANEPGEDGIRIKAICPGGMPVLPPWCAGGGRCGIGVSGS
jgi:hypothetical protein